MGIQKGGIAFFDSGIGGLTVMAACESYFPGGVFYYYGDNVHAPYGNLAPKKIERYVFRALKKFRRLKARAVVLACNTATAVCVEKMRKKFRFPIIGTEPAVMIAAKNGGEVLVLATKATVDSARFAKLCQRAKRRFSAVRLQAVACEELAGVIEKNIGNPNFDYAPYLPKTKPTSVVLGCTHYVYIDEVIRAHYGCITYDGNEGIARRLYAQVKEREKMVNQEKKNKILSAKNVKNRVAQPPRTFSNKKGSFREGKNPLKQKANKCSRCGGQEILNNGKKLEKPRIFYLGRAKKFNEKTYKHTFG